MLDCAARAASGVRAAANGGGGGAAGGGGVGSTACRGIHLLRRLEVGALCLPYMVAMEAAEGRGEGRAAVEAVAVVAMPDP